MDHFEGVALEVVNKQKHDDVEVRLRPWRALNAKNNIFNLIVLFYGVERMRALVGGDVDDHFLFDPIAWSWEANNMLWQELDNVPMTDLDGVQTMQEVHLTRARALAVLACPFMPCNPHDSKWQRPHTRTWARTHTLILHVGCKWRAR